MRMESSEATLPLSHKSAGAGFQSVCGGGDEDLVGGLFDIAVAGGELPAQARAGGVDALRVGEVFAAELASTVTAAWAPRVKAKNRLNNAAIRKAGRLIGWME